MAAQFGQYYVRTAFRAVGRDKRCPSSKIRRISSRLSKTRKSRTLKIRNSRKRKTRRNSKLDLQNKKAMFPFWETSLFISVYLVAVRTARHDKPKMSGEQGK